MSVLQKLLVAGLVAGSVAAVPATALASPARASAAAAKIHQVKCRSTTFNVYSLTRREACYEGIGTLLPRDPNVYKITTGENAGIAIFKSLHGLQNVVFHPHTAILAPKPGVELVSLRIIRD